MYGKVLGEAKAAGIEPLEFRRKVESEMRFNLVVHDPETLFNIIDQQRRDQSVIEANDACLLYTSPSPRDLSTSRMPSSA